MAKSMKFIGAASLAAAILFGILYSLSKTGLWLTLTITFATIAYHFIMRLMIGILFDRCMKNQADYTKSMYQIHSWEKKFYEFLRVKKWKGKMPSYDPSLFSPQLHTWSEIAQAMCQAELVHKTIVIFSFFPIFAAIFQGAFFVFLITSVCAALIDLSFVIMQRYNRPRVVRLAEKERISKKNI